MTSATTKREMGNIRTENKRDTTHLTTAESTAITGAKSFHSFSPSPVCFLLLLLLPTEAFGLAVDGGNFVTNIGEVIGWKRSGKV
jgi:hypothetical protein